MDQVSDLIRRYKAHEKYLTDSKTLAEAAKPEKFNGFVWVCEIENVCANLSKYADGRTPMEIITGETPDISEYLAFEFYNWVLFRGNVGLGEVGVGQWLGVSHRVGRLMSNWILSVSVIPISATTVQRMTNDERCTEELKLQMTQYDDKLSVLFDAQSAEINQDACCSEGKGTR